MASSFPNPRRLLVSNQAGTSAKDHAEPGVEVIVDTLEPVSVMPQFNRVPVATHAAIPTSNAEAGRPQLDSVPGSGIVLPGGANIYYLDLAPHSDSPMHRTPSTDYVIVLRGELTVVTPPAAFDVVDGKGSYEKTEETIARAGDVVVQRGCMHSLANRTGDWVRMIGVILAAEPVKVEVAGETKELGESWLQFIIPKQTSKTHLRKERDDAPRHAAALDDEFEASPRVIRTACNGHMTSTMATDAEDQPSPVPEPLTDGDSNATGSDSDSDSGDSPAPQVEWLATARAKRSTAGNRMKSMLANEEPADEDSDLELLFQEDEDDAGFSDKGQDDGSDAQMDSSDDEDENEGEAEDEGEKELQRREREKKLAARKRKAQEAIPAKFRKKVRISQPATPTGATAPQPPKPRPKKKSERASWLPSAADMPTRSSDRKTTKLSKEQLHNQMVEREERRKKQMELMEKKAKKLEAMKKPPMTQEERLAEAAIVEKRNAKSLNRWEEAEKVREEERRAKLAALNNRRLEGPVVTMWSGIVDLSETQLKNVGKLVSIEEKPKRKRPSTAASTAANTAAPSPKPDRPSTAVSTTGTATTASPKAETSAPETALPTPTAAEAPSLPPVPESSGGPAGTKEEPDEPSERITEQVTTEKSTTEPLTSEKPTSGPPTTGPQTTEQKTTGQFTIAQPIIEQAIVEQPTTVQPDVQPTIEKPATGQPSIGPTTTEQPPPSLPADTAPTTDPVPAPAPTTVPVPVPVPAAPVNIPPRPLSAPRPESMSPGIPGPGIFAPLAAARGTPPPRPMSASPATSGPVNFPQVSGPSPLSVPSPSTSLAPSVPSPTVKTEPQSTSQLPLALRPDIGPRFMPPPNPHLTQSPQPSVLAPPVGMPSMFNGPMPVLGYSAQHPPRPAGLAAPNASHSPSPLNPSSPAPTPPISAPLANQNPNPLPAFPTPYQQPPPQPSPIHTTASFQPIMPTTAPASAPAPAPTPAPIPPIPTPTPVKLTKKQQKEAAASAKKAAAKSAAPKKPPPPPEPPEPEPPLEGKVTRSCIILQDFDEEAIKKPDVQTQILFGRKMTKLAKPPHAPLCVITNHPARYRDPKTGLPFYNTYAFKEIQKLMAGDFKFSQLTGTWVGRGDDAAAGVPARFTRPETEDERKERLELKEREKKEAEERKAQEEKLAAEEKAKLEASGPPATEAAPGATPTTTTEPSSAPMAPMVQGGADVQPLPVASGSVPVLDPIPAPAPAAGVAVGPPPPPAGVPPVLPTPSGTKPVAPAPMVPGETSTTGEAPTQAAPVAAADQDTVMTPAPPLGVGTDQTGQAAQ